MENELSKLNAKNENRDKSKCDEISCFDLCDGGKKPGMTQNQPNFRLLAIDSLKKLSFHI